MTTIRHALRSLGKSPGFTVTALATLALCLGANLAIFAVVDAVLVRSLPFPDPERLVGIMNSYPGAGVDRAGAAETNYYDRQGKLPALESISLFRPETITVGDAGSPVRVPIARVSPEFFATLGVPFAMGQAFTEAEMLYGPDQVAVLTDGYWRSQFNADPEILGKTFLNDGLPITIVGVLPPGFRFLDARAKFFRPAAHGPDDIQPQNRHNNNYGMIGRLVPGASREAAQAQIDAFNTELMATDPHAELTRSVGFRTWVVSLHEDHVRDIKPILIVLQCFVFFLLLIGGVNLANLLLIRASGRTKELAIRQALGAGRRHITREVLVETLTLATGGGLLGLLVGAFGIQLLSTLGTDQLPLGTEIVFDTRIALISFAAALGVGVFLALPVIWFNLHTKLAPALQTETRGGTASRAAQNLRHGFIIAQVALAFVLLSGAGLLGVSLQRLLATSPGFHTEQVLTGQLALPWKNYKEDGDRLAFVERLLPALQALPGVTHAAITTGLPFGGSVSDSATVVEGRNPSPGDTLRAHYMSGASAGYWPAMSIALLEGRYLEDGDNQREQRVCLVDQAFAERYWPGTSAVGKRLCRNVEFKEEEAYTVVGVVANVKQRELAEPDGHGAIYFPYRYFTQNNFSVVVRTSLPPAALAGTVQKAILDLDPELPLDDIKPMQVRVDDSLIARRSPTIVAAIFAGVALLLAGIGTYGVLAYAVSQRTREIGVRMALGAMPRDVLLQFLRLGVILFGCGVGIGVPLAWVAGYFMQSQLFGVGAFHPGVVLLTAVIMTVVVLLAVLLPSQRAARVHPLEALRQE